MSWYLVLPILEYIGILFLYCCTNPEQPLMTMHIWTLLFGKRVLGGEILFIIFSDLFLFSFAFYRCLQILGRVPCCYMD